MFSSTEIVNVGTVMRKRRSWHQVDRTIQEIMPCFIQCRAWLSRILAFLLDPVSQSELAFFPDDRFARRSCFSQQENVIDEETVTPREAYNGSSSAHGRIASVT